MTQPIIGLEKEMLVFDSLAWGGKDKGDNSQFWKRCEILSVQGDTATVRFPDGRESRGHFISSMRQIHLDKSS